MNRFIFIIILSILGATTWSIPVLAATSVLFSSTSINVEQGQDFTLTMSVNPGGVKNYTVKLELNYPADLLEVKSFTFASNWMPLSQAGYDSINNTNGILIKTAGYPGGLSSTATFGTISFSAKKAGNGTITIGSNSLALDSTNQNVLSGTPQASVAITSPAPAAEEVVAPAPETPAEERPISPVSPEEEEEEEAETTEEEEEVMAVQPEDQSEEKRSLLAAVGSLVTLGTNSVWIGILVVIVILAILIYLVYYFSQKSRKKKIE